MNLPDFLNQGSMGEIRFVGSRIDLYFVIERYNEGWTAEMIARDFDSIALADVHKAIAFYLENPQEVDAYMRDTNRLFDEAAAKYPHVDADKLRTRLAEQHEKQAARAAE